MMKKLLYTLPLLALLLLTTTCEEELPNTMGNIYGIVGDMETGDPIRGASVVLSPGNRSTVTGSDGHFEFLNLEAAQYKIQVSANGYVTNSRQITVLSGTSTSGDIMLRQTTAQMSVSTDKLNFGDNEKSLSFDVVAKGDRQVEWTVKENIDWLSCSPANGKITNSSSSVIVTIDRKGLPDGVYKDVIVVSTTDEKIPDKTIHVEMTVNRNVLKVEPAELDFGADETTLQLKLKNIGAELLAFSVESSSEWLVPSKTMGAIDATGSIEFGVSVVREGLVAATYTGTLNFVFGNNSVTVPVKMTVEPATMAVSTEKLVFTADETSLSFDVTTTGVNPLEWYIKEDIAWLSCSPVSGKMTNASASVVVTVNRDGLDDGTYKEVLVVSSKDEKVGDKAIVVEMMVHKNKLQVVPTELDFGGDETTLPVTLKNTGTSTLKYTVTSSNEWLVPSKTSGEVTTTDKINAIVSRQGLAVASYTGTLTFSFDGGSVNVPVKMEVEDLKAPLVSLENQVTGIGYNRATVRGMIADIGSSKITRYGFCWAEQANPTVDMGSVNLGDCTEPKSFEAIITGLQPNTTYHLRAYAENSVGLVYSGNEITFTTHDTPVLATVTTGEVSNVSDVSATVGGSISNLGNVEKLTAYGHVWSTSASQAVVGMGESTNYGSLSEVRTFNSVLSDLKEKTTYYVRAYATNEMGTAYGDIVEFTTEKTPVKDVTSGLYAYYTFEDNTKNVVEGGYNATAVNAPSYVESVNGTKAIKFSTMDNSHITVPEPMIDGGTFTVSFWVKGLSDGHIFHVVSKSSQRGLFNLFVKNGSLYHPLYSPYIDNSGVVPYSHATISSSEWVMVTLTSIATNATNYSSRTTTKLYINGDFVDVVEQPYIAYAVNDGLKFVLGGSYKYASNINALNMTVDNLRIYNTRALSDVEVEQIYKYESQ